MSPSAPTSMAWDPGTCVGRGGHRGVDPRGAGSVVRAFRELELVAPPGAGSAHSPQTSLEAAAVPRTYTVRDTSSTLRVVQSVDGLSPSACRAALRRAPSPGPDGRVVAF